MIRADQHLVLVGMMGVGKSTIGRIVAERLGRVLIDTDAAVEHEAGRTVREIFATEGEASFRARESAALAVALDSEPPAVIATGGGVVLADRNRQLLEGVTARVVWLSAEPSTLVERLRTSSSGTGSRPLLDSDAEGTLQRMCAEREALYRSVADAIVRVDQRSVSDVVEAVLR
ncbi:MAG: shikimate kinase [Ilumatobacteraceae bacterium]